MSNSLRMHGLQHARLPYPCLSPRVCSNSYPLNQWCCPTTSSSVALFSCPQSFPASGTFPVSRLFTSSGQGIGASASPVLPMNIQGWFPLELTGLISLQSKGLSRVPAPQFKHINSMVLILLYGPTQLLHPYMTTGKTIALTVWTFVSKVISLLFNTLSRFVIAFLLRSKHLLISWLQSPSTVILDPKKITSVTASTFSLSICHEVMGLDAMILVFCMLSFKPVFSLYSFTLSKRPFSSSSLSAIRVIPSAYLLPAILIPVCDSPSLVFHMMYSAYKLNKQGDTIQPWHTPFPILDQSVVPCPVLTVASWPAHRFLRRQVRWSGIPISLRFSKICHDPHSQRL